MRINLNNVKFVKARNMHVNPFKSTLEKLDSGYVVDNRVEGVAIIPYRHGTNGKEILIRDEYTPVHSTVLSLVRGRKDPEDGSSPEWWRETARRELLEEAGILADQRWFSYVGEILPAAHYKNSDILVIVDVTGVHQGRPATDGSIFEKKSTNFWVSVYDVLKMVREPNNMDSYLLAAITMFLSWCGLMPWGKSIESLAKDKKGSERPGHKYIRRIPLPQGGYKYIYKEPEGKKGTKPEEKPKGVMAQLAELLGKKQAGGEKEKKIKKELPFDEFSTVPKDIPDFRKGMSAVQWMAEMDRMVSMYTNEFINGLDDADYEVMNDPKNSQNMNAYAAISMLDRARDKYGFHEPTFANILVENKSLSETAQREVKRSILIASSVVARVNHLTTTMNSSLVEKIFDNIGSKLDAGTTPSILDAIDRVVSTLSMHLQSMGTSIKDLKWLQGSDPKLDWMIDKAFESVDELMKSRDRFIKNGLKFYVNRLSSLVESLKDAEEINLAIKIFENFESFKEETIQSTVTARHFESFANQWNMKQRGIYDSASRFSAYVAAKMIDKIRSLESLGDDNILKNHIENLAKSPSFVFLSMGRSNRSFGLSEQIFSYIDLHGMKKYYEDMIYIAGGRKKKYYNKRGAEISEGYATEKDKLELDHFADVIKTLTKAYNGENVYWDDDALYQSERASGGIGNQRPGRFSAMYTAMNTMLLLNKNTPMASKMPAFISMWSVASNNSLISNMIEEFVTANSIDRSTFVNYHVASNRTVNTRRASIKDAMAQSIQQIYKETQDNLSNLYINPKGKKPIRLYRGNGESEVKSMISSWTPKDDVAVQFGSNIVTVEAPIEAVLLAYHEDNRDFWAFPHEEEHVLIPGVLPTNKRPEPDKLPDDARQRILDKKLEEEAMAYGENYA